MNSKPTQSTTPVVGIVLLVCLAVGKTNISAQGFGVVGDTHTPTVSPIPITFLGNWEWATHRQPCGPDIVDSYGNNIDKTAGRPFCQWPAEEVIKHLNGRGRAWMNFVRGDDAISPAYTCVAAGLGTVLTEGRVRTFISRADALVMYFQQGNWDRWIYTDGRKHPSPTEAYYHGHSIGWMEGKTLVVETTNLTWDPDGYDDHFHMARSHMAKITERYRIMESPDMMEQTLTVDDPLFLKEPVTFVGVLKRTKEQVADAWDCDPVVAVRELYSTFKNPYPDDKTPEKFLEDPPQ